MKGRNLLGTVTSLIQVSQFLAGLLPKAEPEFQPPPIENTDPMEGMAGGSELLQYHHTQGAFYLGNIHADHGTSFPAGISDDRHIFLVASNAAGKGRSFLVQNALRWQGGLFALDPKGEIASITALRRGTQEQALGTGTSVRNHLGQKVVILDPFSETIGAARRYQVRYNPLSDIDMRSERAQGQIKKIAAACIVPEEGKNEWVSVGAETILAGAIEAVLLTYPKKNHNLPFVRQLLINSFSDLLDIFEDKKPASQLREFSKTVDGKMKHFREIQKSRGRIPSDGLAAEARGMLTDSIGTEEAGIYRGSLSKNLKWLSEPEMRRHVEHSDISLADLVTNGGSVYVVVPPNRIEDFKSWLRIITQTAINAKVALGVNQTTQPTLFMLDEFPLLGTFKEIEKSAGFLRGYNCKLVIAIQNIGQIKSLYKNNWETFLGNAGAIIGFATNDLETEKYLSERTGKILAWETTFSINQGMNLQGLGGGVNSGKGINQAQRERFVRLSNEIHEQGARHTMRAFVIPADGKPFMVHRQNYDAIPQDGLFDSPQFNVLWEQEYGGQL